MVGLTLGERAAGVVFVDEELREASLGWLSARDRQAGAALVREAANVAARVGARRIVGPHNVSTWRRYRCVVDGVVPDAPAFLGWALMQRHIDAAVAAGFTHGLYALMEKARPLLRYAQNPKRMPGAELATVFRHYALFEQIAA